METKKNNWREYTASCNMSSIAEQALIIKGVKVRTYSRRCLNPYPSVTPITDYGLTQLWVRLYCLLGARAAAYQYARSEIH